LEELSNGQTARFDRSPPLAASITDRLSGHKRGEIKAEGGRIKDEKMLL
jgi:hypothetical protein